MMAILTLVPRPRLKPRPHVSAKETAEAPASRFEDPESSLEEYNSPRSQFTQRTNPLYYTPTTPPSITSSYNPPLFGFAW